MEKVICPPGEISPAGWAEERRGAPPGQGEFKYGTPDAEEYQPIQLPQKSTKFFRGDADVRGAIAPREIADLPLGFVLL